MPLSTVGRLTVGGRLWATGSMVGAGLGGIKGEKGVDKDGGEVMFKQERLDRIQYDDGECWIDLFTNL